MLPLVGGEHVVARFFKHSGEQPRGFRLAVSIDFLIDLRDLSLKILVGRIFFRVLERGRVCRLVAAAEDAVQRVVILRGDGIEFVIVAARARAGEAHQPFRHDINAVVEDVVEVPHETLADGEETERGELGYFRLRLGETVGGDLFDDELVVRQILVEGVNDVVAISPRVRVERLALAAALAVAGRVGVARDVEPVPRPTLAVARRCEEAIDELFKSVRRFVGDERIHFRGSRREADQIVGDAADECLPVGFRRGLEFFVGQLCEDETINRILDEMLRVGRLRHGLSGDLLKRPMILRGVLVPREFARGLAVARIGRADFHPLLEVGDHLGGELVLLRRHGHVGILVLVAHGDEEQALLGLAGDDGGAAVAAFEHRFCGVEQQAALDFLAAGAVAFVATLHEDGPDFFLEKIELREVGRCRRACEIRELQRRHCCGDANALGALAHVRD